MNSSPTTGRRVTLTLAGLIAIASTVLVLAISGTDAGHAAGDDAHAASVPVSTATPPTPVRSLRTSVTSSTSPT